MKLSWKLLSREFRVALPLPWELLYADDLVVIAETEDDLIKRLNEYTPVEFLLARHSQGWEPFRDREGSINLSVIYNVTPIAAVN